MTDLAGISLIEELEGLRLQRYLDEAGVPTIGYGTTASVVDPVPERCTPAQAQAWLLQYVEKAVDPAIAATGQRFNDNQRGALRSFGYNLGAGALGPASTVGHLLRLGRLEQAADAMLLYDHDIHGQVIPGLARRRELERALFLTAPPQVLHYERFPTGPFTVAGRRMDERAVVERYDQLRRHGVLNRIRLRPVRYELVLLAARVKTLLDERGDQYWRAWRLGELEGRGLHGRRYAR